MDTRLWGNILYFEVMNIWQAYEKTISNRCHFCSCEKKAWKKFRLVWDSNPWPLRYWCSALTSWANKPTGSRSLNWFAINQWKDDEVMNMWQSTVKQCIDLQNLILKRFPITALFHWRVFVFYAYSKWEK